MDHEKPHRSPSNRDREQYSDDSDDFVARVRRAKEAAQRKIEAFGEVSKYEIRKIHGQRTDIDYSRPPKKKEEAAVASAAPEASTVSQESSGKETQTNAHRQTSLEFGSGVASEES